MPEAGGGQHGGADSEEGEGSVYMNFPGRSAKHVDVFRVEDRDWSAPRCVAAGMPDFTAGYETFCSAFRYAGLLGTIGLRR